ncbi:hypothetical protein ACA910_010308 [Epithemia clementina (nom. ined.)]
MILLFVLTILLPGGISSFSILPQTQTTTTQTTTTTTTTKPQQEQEQQRYLSCRSRFFRFHATVEGPRDTTGTQRPPSRKDSNSELNDDIETSDEALLRSVKKDQLIGLCQQFNLDGKGTKAELLARLRDYGKKQREEEKSRRDSYVRNVEEGYGSTSKERFETLPGGGYAIDDDEDNDEFLCVFYDADAGKASNETSSPTADTKNKSKGVNEKPSYLTQAAVTSPPMPPDLKPNEKGERVVTIYSTTEHNDLTGISTVQQPGQRTNTQDMLQAAAGGQKSDRPWEMESEANKKSGATNQEIEQATETVTDLVQLLLAQTGAPAFRALLLADEEEDSLEKSAFSLYEGTIPKEFIGFDPLQVPTNQLASASKALRTCRGQVLDDVLRQLEMQAIGQDGIAGDNRDKGGGHYREVSKVRAFLEGYRRAEVRKLARETTTLLLDKLVQEGVEGLDLTLASMTRSSDDTSDFAGELNDSLFEFLNDAIRQQEKKVDQIVAFRFEHEEGQATGGEMVVIEPMDELWNVTIEDGGQRVESIDPNDPMVKMALVEEFEKAENSSLEDQGESLTEFPDSAPEKLLLLLSLLRERLQAEAAFAPDGKGRSLRLLAYCLRISSEREREQLLSKEIGSSLDSLDSFIELVESSIEYVESTSHQLQPARTKRPLEVRQLKSILIAAKKIQERQKKGNSW